MTAATTDTDLQQPEVRLAGLPLAISTILHGNAARAVLPDGRQVRMTLDGCTAPPADAVRLLVSREMLWALHLAAVSEGPGEMGRIAAGRLDARPRIITGRAGNA